MILPHTSLSDSCKAYMPRIAHVFTMTACLALALALGGCLPGKEEEKKVIARIGDASETVQAQKLAADMAMAAERHLSTLNSTTPAITDEATLKSVQCGSGKVLAFVPRTSPLTDDGALSLAMADRMRSQLGSKYNADSIKTAGDPALTSCLTDPTLVAENSPVLILESTVAAMTEVNQHDYTIQSVNMAPCSGGRPGVVVTKTVIDASGTPTTLPPEEHCGASAPASSALPSISFTTGEMADWQSRLVGNNPGPVLATRNYTCIAGSAGCTPVEIDAGTQIECDASAELTEYISNPQYDAASLKFVPTAAPRDCGRGWSGELAARVKQKRCTIKRDGVVTSEVPKSIYDIAYVGAQCRKSNIEAFNSCPVSAPYAATGRMMTNAAYQMTSPLSLTPQKINGQNVSRISWKAGTTSNLSPEGELLLQSPLSLTTTGGQSSKTLFTAQSDINTSQGTDFDRALVQDLQQQNKLTQSNIVCMANAQDCRAGQEKSAIAFVVDRSAIMQNTSAQQAYPSYTSCRATMVNMFKEESRVSACSVISQWNTLATQQNVIAYVKDNWNYALVDDPVTQAINLYNIKTIGPNWNSGTGVATGIDEPPASNTNTPTSQLNSLRASLNAMLKNQTSANKQRLFYALAVGQTCAPASTTTRLIVQEDMFGQCAQETVTAATYNLFGIDGRGERNTCQNTCPGTCVTRIARVNGQPNTLQTPTNKRLATADSYISKDIVSKVPSMSNVVYVEGASRTGTGFNASISDNAKATTLYQAPSNATQANNGRAAAIVEMRGKLKLVKDERPANAASTTSALYRSIDIALDNLRANGLDSNPNMVANIIVMGNEIDRECVTDNTDWYFRGAAPYYPGDPETQGVAGAPFINRVPTKTRTKDMQANPACANARLYHSAYFGRNICEPTRKPVAYRCHYCPDPYTETHVPTSPNPGGQLNTGLESLQVGQMNSNGTMTCGNSPSVYEFQRTIDIPVDSIQDRGADGQRVARTQDTPVARLRACYTAQQAGVRKNVSISTDGSYFDGLHWNWGPGQTFVADVPFYLSVADVEPIYPTFALAQTGSQYDSLVGFIARNYPNVRIHFVDFGSTNSLHSLQDFCALSQEGTDNPNPSHKVTDWLNPSNNRVTQMFFGYKNEAQGKAAIDSIIQKVANTAIQPTTQDGIQNCIAKYGPNVTINTDPVPSFTANISDETAVCGQPVIMQNGSLEPPAQTKRFIPPASLYDSNVQCVEGYRPHTLKTCTMPPVIPIEPGGPVIGGPVVSLQE